MNDDREHTEEEIRAMAIKFFNETIKPMFPPNIVCEACHQENCVSNEVCWKCGCQL